MLGSYQPETAEQLLAEKWFVRSANGGFFLKNFFKESVPWKKEQ